MHRAKGHWTWIIIGALILLISIPAILFLTHWPFTREKIAADLQKQFPGPVEIQEFHNTYFPHPGCVATGVIVRGASTDPQRPLINARSLTIQGAYSSFLILSKSINIRGQGVRVFIPAHYDRGAHGQSDSKGSIADLQLDDAVLEIGREGHDPLRFQIHHLSASPIAANKEMKFRVAFTHPLPPGEVNADGRLGPWQSGRAAGTPLSGSYTFEHADLGAFSAVAGTLSSAGKFQGSLGKITVEGWTRSPNFEIRKSGHPVSAEARFRADVNGANGDVHLRETAFSWNKTTLVAAGDIAGRPNQTGKTVDLKIAVQRGRIEDLMRLVMHSDPTMQGPANFRGTAVLPPGHEQFIQRVRFAADFTIAGAEFTRPNAQQGVDKLSERARGDKDNDLERVLSNLKGHVVLGNGVARFTNGSFAVPDAVSQFSGTCNMVTKQIDLEGRLRMAATISQAATGLKSVLLKVVDPLFKDKKHHAGSDVPVKMTGTFSHPKFGLDLR